MTYEDCWLWKRAFTEKRDDASEDEQEFFRNIFLAMREKVSQLVSFISSDLPEFTVHDITHLDALWEMGSIVTSNKVDLNPPEALVFGASVLLHDAAMTVYAYSGGLPELKKETVFKDSVARLRMEARDNNTNEFDPEIEMIATKETLRLLHAERAERLANTSWNSGKSKNEEYLIDDPAIRGFYGPTIGKVAHSHWWPLAKIAEEFKNGLGPFGRRTQNRIDLIKVACILRIADAIHIDSRRAPQFLRLLVKPSGISEQHWTFQGEIAVPVVKYEALQYSAASPFNRSETDAWWLAFDTISVINQELRDVDHLLLQLRKNWRFTAKGVIGASSPRELSEYIKTDGWDPVDCAVRVTDVPKIVEALGGEKLYGSDTSCAIRELIQNAADAVVMRRSIENRDSDWGSVSVRIKKQENKHWLVVEDTGIGMSSSVLTGPLVDFGNSFWRSPLAAREFPGIHSTGVSPIGRYGIGFFAVFMLGKKVLVSSRRYNSAFDSARTLEFRNGLGSRPILYATPSDKVPRDGGTRVEVCLDKHPLEEGGILVSKQFARETINLKKLIGLLAPSLNVKLSVAEAAENEQIAVGADDWLELDENQLLDRLTSLRSVFGEKIVETDGRLRFLKGPDGFVYGRASIRKPNLGGDNTGCVSVGGLRASSVNWINGLFRGREKTVTRNSAVVDLPPEVLAEWASEQARLLERAKLPDETKAYGASVVLLCGGEIGNLPVARYNGIWHRTSKLKNVVLDDLDEALVLFENEVRYDEDIDDVHPRSFTDSFKENEKVIFVPDDFPGTETLRSIESLFETCQAGNFKASLSAIFRSILEEAWGQVDKEDKYATVGTVYDTEIERDLTRFYRY